MRYDITHAIQSLCPNATWRLHGSDYSGLVWLDIQIDKPEEAALLAEVDRLQAAWDRNEYSRKRAAEYPPIFDYLDAVVKNDISLVLSQRLGSGSRQCRQAIEIKISLVPTCFNRCSPSTRRSR